MSNFKKHITTLIIVFTSILIIGLTTYAYWINDFLNPNYILGTDKLGDFGSFIGGLLGTIITLIATVYVYKTYVSQKEELKSQKQELTLQRQLITHQQFESTFFNMLNVHRELKNNLEVNVISRICRTNINRESMKPSLKGQFYSPTTISEIEDFKGVNVFKFIRLDFENLYRCFKELSNETNSFDSDLLNKEIFSTLFSRKSVLSSEIDTIHVVYEQIFKNYKDLISHYCRNVYHILKFIRETEKQNDISYRKYADIFQSQLNVDEQFLLFYNFIVFDYNDNVDKDLHPKNIVNYYEFLENLGHDNLLDSELHNYKKFYTFHIK